MKKYFTKIAFCLILVMGGISYSSCTDYLDKSPLADIDPDEAFKNFRNIQGFTEELYNCIPLVTAQGYHNSWNYGEDEIWERAVSYPLATRFDQGDYRAWEHEGTGWFRTGGSTSNQARFDKGRLWSLAWYGIRKANIGIENLDKMTESTTEERNIIAGQLYFFRAWFHFMLMQYWGGLPYLDTTLPTDEVLKLPRMNYQETAEKAALDFQQAADLLPVDWDQTSVGQATLGNNSFRINKIMSLAYLGKNLLWAGSPLMNEESTGNISYNQELCKRAADALGQALKLTESTGRYVLADFSQYSSIFYLYNQSGRIPGLKEAIFVENLAESAGRWRWNQVNDYRPTVINSSGVKVYPTSNYVTYYGMKNGLPIQDIEKKDPESGYDPEFPWKDRDPRFYHDIIFDGVMCCLNSRGNLSEEIQYASLYTGGDYRDPVLNPNDKAVFTGYMNSKFTSKLMNDWDGYKENNVLVLSFMRLSDVYLMYAEAVANGYGTPQSKSNGYELSAVDAINKVRKRPGLDVGGVADKFLGSTEDFMSELRRERAVELAFEGHRFVDLRRWKLLLDRPYIVKKSVDFDRVKVDYKNPENSQVANLRETVLIERQLSERHYWFPFRVNDVSMYKEFQQNPGW
ncbi:MAG: RagB/SusD family nutrient uptake outer membrane protein [Kiritimatiellae bacterium]|nr:RagB/SusD family nutrient uptake outer membrane protein [Kiritimatiellia bacterium]